ncbi:WPE palindromic element domain-containing protein [Wolbachia endosymbiont of Tettigetta isshikii]
MFYYHPSSRHWHPENLTLNERIRWLCNRNWIPVSNTGMTPFKFRTAVHHALCK